MSLLSVLIPTNSTKSWFETVLSEGICPLAHESEASWFPYLFLSKSWRKTNCWNVYTARIGPCCVLGPSLPRLRDKRFCGVFLWGVRQLWTESICHLKCAWVSIDSRFLQFWTELSLLKSGPKFYCSLGGPCLTCTITITAVCC